MVESPAMLDADWVERHLKAEHPRLILDEDTARRLASQRGTDEAVDELLSRFEAEAKSLLDRPAVRREMVGRRLLHTSREVLWRLTRLALVYRLTGDAAYLHRAEAELRAVLAFTDWNPSHFLDVAEMAAAVALAYDWLYHGWSEDFRAELREGLHRHAVGLVLHAAPGESYGWETANSNWNSVCYAGLTLAVLATAERDPAAAGRWLTRVRQHNPRALEVFAPDGVYPEGPSYWSYGVTFQVVLLAALESALGDDLGLADLPGFLQTGTFMRQVTGPSGLAFNFSDAGARPIYEPALAWLAKRNGRPGVARSEGETPAGANSVHRQRELDRLLPLMAIWQSRADPIGDQPAGAADAPPRYWLGRGIQPLAVFRSAWGDPAAAFLATKGGRASLSHGHMDAGSFVLDALGARWAEDLGMQDYESLESKGFSGLFQSAQDSPRWTVYRLNNFSHNTLTIDGHLHRAEGQAAVSTFSGDSEVGSVTYDLSQIFVGDAMRVERSFRFDPEVAVTIHDVAEGVRPGAMVRWTMLTRAAVEVDGGRASLSRDGRTLRVHLGAPAEAAFFVRSAEPEPPTDHDAPNPGVRRLLVEVPADAAGRVEVRVTLRWG